MFFRRSSPDPAPADDARPLPVRRARRPAAALRIAAAVLGLCIALAAVEITVRILHASGRLRLERPHDSDEDAFVRAWIEWRRGHEGMMFNPWVRYDARLGWIPEPGLRNLVFDDFPPVSTNSRSMRGEREYADRPAAGTTRILVVGDSFTFGFSAPDEHVWVRLLEDSLPQAEALNMGVPGYGTDQMLLRLERDGLPLKPDIVIAAVYEDDLNRNLLTFRDYPKPRFRSDAGELVEENIPVPTAEQVLRDYGYRPPASYALYMLRGRIRSRMSPRDDPEGRRERDALSGAILARMARVTAYADSRFLVVYIPRYVDALFQPDPVRDHLQAESARSGFELLDLTPVLREAVRQYDRSPYTDHFNLFGQLLTADAVRKHLIREGWIVAPNTDPADLAGRIEAEGGADALTAADHLGRARMLIGLNRRGEAVQQFRAAIAKGADRADIHAELALVLDEENRTEESVAHFQRALELEPDDARTLNNFAIALDRLGRAEDAEARLLRAIGIDPAYAEARFNLAQVYLGQGRTGEAADSLREALRIEPEFAQARTILNQIEESGP